MTWAEMLKPKGQTRVTSDRQQKHTIQKMRTDLAWEGCPVQRLYKVCVHLVGAHNDSGHGLLVLQGRGGQKRESGQGDVVLDTGQAALIVAIWTQAAQKTERNTQGEGHSRQLKLFQIHWILGYDQQCLKRAGERAVLLGHQREGLGADGRAGHQADGDASQRSGVVDAHDRFKNCANGVDVRLLAARIPDSRVQDVPPMQDQDEHVDFGGLQTLLWWTLLRKERF